MHITVVIPTYRRPTVLLDCVRSLVDGSLLPHEIVVIGREGDADTAEALRVATELCVGKTALRSGWVTEPGHLPPIQKGLELASGKIVAFIDDDVTVTTAWLARLIAGFGDPNVAVIGGRVITPAASPARLKGDPGRTSWYGKHWGNIGSLDSDGPVAVESVMECNWAWRREFLTSLRFDPVLNFDDASMYGLDMCLQAKRRGMQIVYEPRAIVYHHVAARAPELDRADRVRRGFSYARNYTYIMMKHLPWWRRPVFLAWWFLVGERGAWGLAAMVAENLRGTLCRPAQLRNTVRAKLEGLRLARQSG